MTAVSHFDTKIAEREAELRQLEELKSQVEAMESRPAALRDEIAALEREKREHVGAAEARYLNAMGPYVEARDKALALIPVLADAIERAISTYAEVDAAYRTVVNLGVEPGTPKPDRSDILAMRDRELQLEFTRLTSAIGGRW